MREHIDRLNVGDTIFSVEQLKVTSLGCRVAAHIDNDLWFGKQDGVDHVFVHTSTRRVGDDDIRTAMLVDEVNGENVLHVASIEERVVDAVYCRIDLCILNSLWHIFDAHNLPSLT